MADVSLKWRLTRWTLGRLVAGAVRRHLRNRELIDCNGRRHRWLRPEIGRLLFFMSREAEMLREEAELNRMPSFGNRLMVELAVYTAAIDRALRHMSVDPRSARDVVGDVAWDLYRRSLFAVSLPFRLVTRSSGRRLRWTIRTLLRFPFNAPGAPGYEVETRVEGDDIWTYWTHCPPQSFVRRVSEKWGDPEALECFQATWCLYDWPGADLIAGDGKRGHYSRTRTLSRGDPVCDMCWMAHGSGDPYPNEAAVSSEADSPADPR